VSTRPPAAEPAKPTETDKLHAEVIRLSLLIGQLNEKLAKSERFRSTADSERNAAREAQQSAEEKLRTALATIRRLEAEATVPQDANTRIAELEAEVAAMRAQGVIAPEVAEALKELNAKR
jgi:hypothetical protein